jgi:hypothetical protein
MEKDYLTLKRGSISHRSGKERDDDYDVLADGGRMPWMWTLALGHHEDRTPTQGYAATREAAMAAFVKSWRRQ